MKAVTLALVLLPAVAAAASHAEVHYVMGTFFRITAEGTRARPAMRRCFQDARRLEAVFSRFDPDSELTRVNVGAGAPARVSADFASLLARAQRLELATGGAFDVTVGGLTELWRRDGAAPTASEVARARARIGGARAVLTGDLLQLVPGTRLDFDGIAKGYAVDACAERLRREGLRRALVSLGESSVLALGAPRGATHWTLAIRGTEPEQVVGTLRLRDQAISVSATYGARGRAAARVGHIIDPRSGQPLREEAVAVVVAASATDAEAYSKALLLWGAAGVARIERLGAAGAVHIGPAGIRPGSRAAARHLFEALDQGAPVSGREGRR